MKFVATLIAISAVAIATSFGNNRPNHQEADNQRSTGLWQEGKVPYEISRQFAEKDSNMIKEALLEIMKTTCIKFVPRTNNQPDYVVFMEYKHSNQEIVTCWSGNKWNNGTSTIGNGKGRHIVSLWRDLECFNHFDIIRQTFNLLGSKVLKSAKAYGAYHTYEESIGEAQKSRLLMISHESDSAFLRKHLYAFDNKLWISTAKRDSRGVMRSVDQINRIYNCPSNGTAAAASTSAAALNHAHPNCKMEAEAGTCRSDPNYVNAVCGKSSVCDGWGVTYGIPSPRRANLINGFGKCVGVSWDSSSIGDNLLQWDCKAQKGMLWSWNEASLGSGDIHLCNAHGKCAGARANIPSDVEIFQWDHVPEEGQRHYFLESLLHPGYYLIRNGHGKCMAVPENTDRNGAEIHARDCNVSEAGQHWKWNIPY